MKRKKICIVAPVHIYSDIRVFQKEALTLAKAGYDVTLIARKEDERPVDDVRIIPMPRYRNRLMRFLLQPWVFRQVLKSKAEIVHLHNPDTLLMGLALKLAGKRVVYDTHENFTNKILIKAWIPKPLRKLTAALVGMLERLGGIVFDVCIATEEAVRERLGRKAVIIENAPITQGDVIDRAYRISESLDKGGVFRVIYAGAISADRGLFQMVDAMELVNRWLNARLWLIGKCANERWIEEVKARPGWKYVDYLGFRPQEEAFAYMIKSDVGLCPCLRMGGYDQTNPNKLFEYQRFGLPFVASDFESWKHFRENARTGLFVNPDRPEEIANAILQLAEHPAKAEEMGKIGQTQVLAHYNWENESVKLINLYSTLASS